MNFKYAFFLGSHPALSASEALGVLSRQGYAPAVELTSSDFLLVTTNQEIPASFLSGLGGSTRIARVIARQNTPWTSESIWPHIERPNAPKMSVGISTIGHPARTARDIANDLKALAREHGVRLRFILPRGHYPTLNAAQILFNDLIILPNQELVLLHHAEQYYLLTTIAVQDIAAYELRDIKRPARDPRVGMLPPKLAQIILNLAVSHLPATAAPVTILDPFCGLGTIIQEGWLQGHIMTGSDANRKNVEGAKTNVDWVREHYPGELPNPSIRTHDVKHPFPDSWHESFDAIVTEPFLGRPLHAPLTGRQAADYLSKLADLYYLCFRHAYPILKPGGIILFLLPAIRQSRRGDTFALVPNDFLDAITKLGYIPKQLSRPELAHIFPSSERQSLIYSRPDAFTGREITLWEKR